MVNDVLIGRTLKGITDSADFSLEGWPHPDLGTLAQIDRDRFLQRKEAVTLYLQGNAHADIYAATGVQARFLNRLIHERCMHIHPNGRIFQGQHHPYMSITGNKTHTSCKTIRAKTGVFFGDCEVNGVICITGKKSLYIGMQPDLRLRTERMKCVTWQNLETLLV